MSLSSYLQSSHSGQGVGLSFRPWSPRELSEELSAHAPTMYSSGSSLQMRSGPYPDGVSRRSNDGSRGTRATSNSSNYNHNAVDIGRIRAGLDVRTTVSSAYPTML